MSNGNVIKLRAHDQTAPADELEAWRNGIAKANKAIDTREISIRNTLGRGAIVRSMSDLQAKPSEEPEPLPPAA